MNFEQVIQERKKEISEETESDVDLTEDSKIGISNFFFTLVTCILMYMLKSSNIRHNNLLNSN